MKRLVALVVLSFLLAVLSFEGEVIGHNARFTRRDSPKTVAIAAKRTERLGLYLVELLN